MKPSIAIIGGGPVGLYLGIRLAQKGYKADIYEKRIWPIDKVCGQGIMPAGFKCLKKIGLNFSHELDSFEFSRIEYLCEKSFIKGELPGVAVGIERQKLSAKLYEKASSYDLLSFYSSSLLVDIKSLLNNSNELKLLIDGQESKRMYDYVFACDGLNSKTRDLLANTKLRKCSARMGARSHFNIRPWFEGVQVYWNNGIEAYVTPVQRGKTEIAFLWDKEKVEAGANLEKRLFDYFPSLSRKIKNVKLQKDFKAYGPFMQVSKKMKLGNVFFVGDAYQFLDGITGEGLSMGFKSADIFVDSFETFNAVPSLKILWMYFNYKFWVMLALVLSRNTFLRKAIFTFLKIFPKIFNTALLLNDRK